MKIHAIIVIALLTLFIGSVALADNEKSNLEILNQNKDYSFQVGSYRILLRKTGAWTFGALDYNNKSVLRPSGWMQPVLNVNNQGKDPWVGTGHGHEIVESIDFFENGKSILLPSDKRVYIAPANTELKIVKHSILGPYKHRAELVVSERGFYQHYYFDTITDTSNVNYLYPFMLIFANTADRWMVGLEDTGILSGTFPGGAADIYSLQKDKLIFLAVFDEKSHLATVCLPAQAYKTYQAKGNFFNDRKYDNKYYCKVSPSKKIGEKFEYQMTMKCVDATIDNFEQITTDAVKVMQENAK